jgi:acyl carrier protein
MTNHEMTNQDLIQLLADALEIEASSIDTKKAIAKYAEWDSLAWLTIISLLDERYGIRLAGTELRGLVTVNDLIENVTAKAPVA